MPWLDTSSIGSGILYLKVYNGTDWVILVTYPATNATVFRKDFLSSATTWTVTHNLNQVSVAVDIYDVLGHRITALDVDTNNVNEAVITHAFPMTGRVIVIG
jgi:hypothetical protein